MDYIDCYMCGQENEVESVEDFTCVHCGEYNQ